MAFLAFKQRSTSENVPGGVHDHDSNLLRALRLPFRFAFRPRAGRDHHPASEERRLRNPRLFGCRGCGSAIIESAFALAGLALDYEEVDYSAGSPTHARLLEMNPLGQVPAVTLPDGSILTESLAIANYLHDLAPQAGLVPPPGDATRAMFHRWIALVCAIYPTFTYGDEPVKWVKDKAGEG